ncbi:MAG: cell division protein SepF [Defluviitaleaceae bacterium]|nr:cell division protein SepF [Defluviitaleaceae bacterium]MCL2273800.1 cell division protein SepF [Defluviitaleaceae bacterium]
MRELWLKVKTSLRNQMLSPGFDDYDSENHEEHYYEEETVSRADSWQDHAIAATAPKATKSKMSDKYVELYGRDKKAAPSLEAGFNVTMLSPKTVDQSNIVTDHLKEGAIIALNLTDIDPIQGQRVVDVVSGAVYALGGSFQRVAKTVFIVAPEGVRITSEIKEELSNELPWAVGR